MRLRWFYTPPLWDHSNEHSHIQVPARRRKLDLTSFETLSFQKRIVFLAGAGFFVDGYLLFANNFSLPILGYLYWQRDTHSDHETGINVATLAGAICGQLALGFLADKVGRKAVYGWELVIVLVASVGVAMASEGRQSMRITPWLVFFRCLTGFGIGAEYPITAVITSEFAPTKHRARMLATVFSMQSFGQFFAALVTLLAVRGEMALDSAWRLVYGVAAIPAAIALVLRFSIPESPRFTFDVLRNPALANHDMGFLAGADPSVANGSENNAQQNDFPPRASMSDIKLYFLEQGNWVSLVATAGAWMLLDLSFYGLGFSSPQIVAGIFNGCSKGQILPSPQFIWDSEPQKPGNTDFRNILQDNETDYMIVVSVGAISGSVLLIFLVNHLNRKYLQLGGFLALALLFFILGAILHTVGNVSTGDHGPKYVVIVFYAFCQLLFNVGPNGLTFMFPAEIFPTRYRCSCHGISAAAGKLGSVVAVLALRKIQFNALTTCQDGPQALSKVLLGFGAVMLLGAAFACFIPNVQNKKDRLSVPLEHLALGRHQEKSQDTELGARHSKVWGIMHRHGRHSDSIDPRASPSANHPN